MNYIIKDGLELLVNLKINLNEEQSRIFKRKFDYVRERYKEKYGRIDYYGLIKITATTYSFVNNENNHDENLIYVHILPKITVRYFLNLHLQTKSLGNQTVKKKHFEI